MFKFVSKLVIMIALLALVLTACAPATTTQAPVSQETTAPVATEGGAPAAGTNWCSGTKIIFFPGGAPGGGFETVVYNGALTAAADTGADVEYLWSDWDPAKMISQFTEAVATKPDAIAVMGHPGDAAFDPMIDDAEAQGILVTSMNTQLPEAQAKYVSQWFWLRRSHQLRGRITR